MAEDNFVVDKFKSLNPATRWTAIGATAAAILLLPVGLYSAGMFAQKPEAAATESSTAVVKPQPVAVTSLVNTLLV